MKWLLLLLPSITLAGWPSLHPFDSWEERANQALSGAVERVTVSMGASAWTNYITAKLYESYFSQATKCRAVKAMLAAAIEAPTSSKLWVFPDADVSPTNYTRVTLTGMVARIAAPADFWTVTPSFALWGASNSTFVSNGWMLIPDVLSNMTDMAYPVSGSGYAYTNAKTRVWQTTYISHPIDQADYEDPATWTNDYSQSYTNQGGAPYVGYSYRTDVYGYRLQLSRTDGDLGWKTSATDAQVTNRASATEFWTKGARQPILGYTIIFDSFGDSVQSNWFPIISLNRGKGQSASESVHVGGPDKLPYQESLALMTNSTVLVGYGLESFWVRHRFNVAGGFEWFK